MKHITKIAIFAVFLLLGSITVAKPAQAFDFNPIEWFKETFNIQKNVTGSMQAQAEASKGGAVSVTSLVPSVGGETRNDLYLVFTGVPSIETNPVLESMTREERQVLYDRYGRGLIGDSVGAIAMLYDPPASGTVYVAELLRSAHIIPQAQAQGLGFSSLDPVLETWKVFRNIAYLFFVVVFLAIGFMIMFRQKIGGQTVVTAQQAIPGIIVSLITVTFSYAIAGFLIDLMYLIMYLMIGLFSPQSGTEIISKNFLQIGFDVVTGVNTNGAFASMNEAVQTFASTIDTSTIGEVLGWIGGITMGLIVSVAILIGVFKLFFELLKIYITIIIAIVVSPVLLMMGAIPGKSNFGYWVKLVFGNLLAFPMVLFSLILYEMFTSGDLSAGGFMPPYLIGRGSGSVMMTLVGIGIIMIIPELIKEMKKALKIDGGIWETLALKAVDQAKAGWTGDGIKGWGVKRLFGAGAFAGTAAAGAGAGALGYGLYERSQGRSFKEGAKKGALFGAAAPIAIKAVPGLAKDAYNIGKSEASQWMMEETVGRAGHQLARKEGKLKEVGENLVQRYTRDGLTQSNQGSNNQSSTNRRRFGGSSRRGGRGRTGNIHDV